MGNLLPFHLKTSKVVGIYNVNENNLMCNCLYLFGLRIKEIPEQRPGVIRIVCVSDTHQHFPEIPNGDIFIHGGDFTYDGRPGAVQDFNNWLGKLPHKHKIVIAGNHDITFQEEYYSAKWTRFHDQKLDHAMIRKSLTNCIYLQDQSKTIEGIKFYGSPWQPAYCDWAFNIEDPAEIRKKWDDIPQDVDILITHGPPKGHSGITKLGVDAGCPELLLAIQRVKPLVHICGHIHEGYGVSETEGTHFINASSVNAAYKQVNNPIVIDIEMYKEENTGEEKEIIKREENTGEETSIKKIEREESTVQELLSTKTEREDSTLFEMNILGSIND